MASNKSLWRHCMSVKCSQHRLKWPFLTIADIFVRHKEIIEQIISSFRHLNKALPDIQQISWSHALSHCCRTPADNCSVLRQISEFRFPPFYICIALLNTSQKQNYNFRKQCFITGSAFSNFLCAHKQSWKNWLEELPLTGSPAVDIFEIHPVGPVYSSWCQNSAQVWKLQQHLWHKDQPYISVSSLWPSFASCSVCFHTSAVSTGSPPALIHLCISFLFVWVLHYGCRRLTLQITLIYNWKQHFKYAV